MNLWVDSAVNKSEPIKTVMTGIKIIPFRIYIGIPFKLIEELEFQVKYLK